MDQQFKFAIGDKVVLTISDRFDRKEQMVVIGRATEEGPEGTQVTYRLQSSGRYHFTKQAFYEVGLEAAATDAEIEERDEKRRLEAANQAWLNSPPMKVDEEAGVKQPAKAGA